MCRGLKKFTSLILKTFLKNRPFSPSLIKESKLTLRQSNLIWLSFCWPRDCPCAYYANAGTLSPIPTPETDFYSMGTIPQGLDDTGLGWRFLPAFTTPGNHGLHWSQLLHACCVQSWSWLCSSLPSNDSVGGWEPLWDESHWPQGEPSILGPVLCFELFSSGCPGLHWSSPWWVQIIPLFC